MEPVNLVTKKQYFKKDEVIIMKKNNNKIATLFQVTNNNDLRQNEIAAATPGQQYTSVLAMAPVQTMVFAGMDDLDICEYFVTQESKAYRYPVTLGDVVNVGTEWYRCVQDGNGWNRITGEPGAIGNATANMTEVQEEQEEETVAENTNTAAGTTEYDVNFNNDNVTPNGDSMGALNAGKEQMGKVYTNLVKYGAGINQSGKDWKKSQQKNIDNFTGSVGIILGALDLAGLKPIRKSIMLLFVKAQNGEITIKQLKDEIQKMILDRIEFLDGLTDEASLKQCATLKAFTAKSGTVYGEKSIIELIICCIMWIIKRTFAKLKEFFGLPMDKMPSIVRFAWGLIKAVFDIILSAGKVVFSIALPGICFVVAGVFKALAWILGWAKGLWNKAKDWFTNTFKKEAPSDEAVSTAETVEVDDDEFDNFDDFEGAVEDIAAELAEK